MKLITQDGFKDCGPTCLLMIIKHYKGNVPIEKLKELCKTDKSGTTAYHLIETAKMCGFTSYANRCKLDNLDSSNTIFPAIAYVLVDGKYQHFVVIEKINFNKKKVYIKDPIGKNYILSYLEFEKIYKDIIIFLYPNRNVINETNPSILKFLYNLLKPLKKELIHTITISFIITFLSIITTFYMQTLFDAVDNSKIYLILVFLIFIIIYIIKIASEYIRNKLIVLLNQKIDLNLSLSSFTDIINLPYSHYKKNTTGEIVSKVNDISSVRDFINRVTVTIIDIPLIFVALVFIYLINFNLFILTIVFILIYILIMLLFSKIINHYIFKCTELKALTTSYMVESINAYDYINGCNCRDSILSKFRKKAVDLSKEMTKFENVYNIELLFMKILDELGFVIIIFIGILLVVNNDIRLGQLLTFNFLFNYAVDPFKNLIEFTNIIKQSNISIKKLINLIRKDEKSGIIEKEMKGDIVFKNLSFSFNDVDNTLNNINLKIKDKSKVMIIGKSGSGKSTLFKLLKKYYKVNRNSIFIDGIDINDYIKSDIVYVSQNEILFTDTIKENINSDDLISLSKICMVDDIIKNMPLGYNTLIEENGFNLSGGEAQRIILARAISKKFNILIIDEGLNQTDISMERKILSNLIKEYKDKTIIYISHRLDNKDLFDNVIKIENGVLSG